MDIDDIQNVAVLGAGSMGHGIAEVAAIAGYKVTMRDIKEDIVQDGYENIEWSLGKLSEKGLVDEDPDEVMSRIDTTTDLESAVEDADFIVEAAPENLEIKHEIFSDLERYTSGNAILATNTSSLPITEIASATDSPERVVGTHFFNPPVKMELVEVIYGEQTSDETAETAHELMKRWGKTPIYVRKDIRGFVVNSVLGPFGDEAAWMVSEGEADIREVDAAMVFNRGYPMGPFELSDMTGIDIGYSVRKEAGRPIPSIVEEKVENNNLGRKTGKGYYDYDDDGVDYDADDAGDFDTLRIEARMINEAAMLIGNDVATAEEIDTGVKLGLGFPEGICRRADKIGLDVVLEKLRGLHEETGSDRYTPDEYLVELVENGDTGKEAGQGFYSYDGEDDVADYQDIRYTLTDDGVLEIVLDRPSRLNALSQTLMEEMQDVLQKARDDDVKCVTFEGAGDRAFCAGADITSFSGTDPIEVVGEKPVFESIYECPKPTIAKIDGYCLGGGFEVALACDLRIASEDSEFGFPEIDLGLIPGGGGTQRIMRLIGETRAKELVFTGRRIDAETAEDWGIINHEVDSEDFEGRADELVGEITSGPPLALKVAKLSMNEGRDADIRTALHIEREGFGLLTTTDDMMEGAAAFMEKRDPEFMGE